MVKCSYFEVYTKNIEIMTHVSLTIIESRSTLIINLSFYRIKHTGRKQLYNVNFQVNITQGNSRYALLFKSWILDLHSDIHSFLKQRRYVCVHVLL